MLSGRVCVSVMTLYLELGLHSERMNIVTTLMHTVNMDNFMSFYIIIYTRGLCNLHRHDIHVDLQAVDESHIRK